MVLIGADYGNLTAAARPAGPIRGNRVSLFLIPLPRRSTGTRASGPEALHAARSWLRQVFAFRHYVLSVRPVMAGVGLTHRETVGAGGWKAREIFVVYGRFSSISLVPILFRLPPDGLTLGNLAASMSALQPNLIRQNRKNGHPAGLRKLQVSTGVIVPAASERRVGDLLRRHRPHAALRLFSKKPYADCCGIAPSNFTVGPHMIRIRPHQLKSRAPCAWTFGSPSRPRGDTAQAQNTSKEIE